MKPFRFKIVKRALKVDLPSFTSNEAATEPEQLTGQVQGMQASAPEERMAKALDKAGIQYLFRYTVGAPRGLPGWKELDFLISSGGLLQAVEVDTAFTHRNKQQSDVLHDAIVLNDQSIQAMGELYPRVMHVSGDSDLSDQDSANKFVKQNFTKGDATVGRATTYETTPLAATQQAPAQQIPQTSVPSVNRQKPRQTIGKTINTQVTRNTSMSRKIERNDR